MAVPLDWTPGQNCRKLITAIKARLTHKRRQTSQTIFGSVLARSNLSTVSPSVCSTLPMTDSTAHMDSYDADGTSRRVLSKLPPLAEDIRKGLFGPCRNYIRQQISKDLPEQLHPLRSAFRAINEHETRMAAECGRYRAQVQLAVDEMFNELDKEVQVQCEALLQDAARKSLQPTSSAVIDLTVPTVCCTQCLQTVPSHHLWCFDRCGCVRPSGPTRQLLLLTVTGSL